MILLFLKWLKKEKRALPTKTNSKDNNITLLLDYFQFLVKVLIKYKLFIQPFPDLRSSNLPSQSKFSPYEVQKLVSIYAQTIENSQIALQLQLESDLFLVTENDLKWLYNEIQNFRFLSSRGLKTA